MSSTSTTWVTDSNTKSGTATSFTTTISSLKLLADEGEDAILRLFADEGDDNADQWRIVSSSSTNKLNFMTFASGSWSTVLDLYGAGGAVVFNEDSADIDFRVESNGNANMLFVDGGNNRVGIGTASPDGMLDIESSANTDGVPNVYITNLSDTADHQGGNLIFRRGDPSANLTDNDVLGDIWFQGQDNSDDAWITSGGIRVDIDGTPNTNAMPGEMSYWLNNDADNVGRVMTLKKSGNVGIGTASPDQLLDIESASIGSSAPTIRIGNTKNAADWHATNEEAIGGLEFYSADTSGDGDAGAKCSVRAFNDNAQYGGYYGLKFGVSGTTANGGDDYTAMTIKKDGNVGIGTTDPGYELDVSGSSTPGIRVISTDGSAEIIIQSNAETANSTLKFASGGASDGRIYYDHHATAASQKMFFKTGDNSVEAMVIDGAGKVGIGTSTPTYNLEVKGGDASNDVTTGGGQIALVGSDTSLVDGDDIGTINFIGADTTLTSNKAVGAKILAEAAGTWDNTSDNDAPTELQFWTTNEGTSDAIGQRMVIDRDGNVGIQETAPDTVLHVKETGNETYAFKVETTNGANTNYGMQILAGVASPSSAGDCKYMAFRESDGGTALGGIQCGSTVANPEFFNGSDERIKKNIADTKVNGLEVVNGFTMKEFEFNKEKFKGQVTDIGFIAQNCEEVYPRMVSEHAEMSEGWGIDEPVKCVSDAALIPVLVKAIQELSAKVTALENK